jgi:hypothetical protein
MEGPVRLAGISDNDPCLYGDINKDRKPFLIRESEHEYKSYSRKQILTAL